MRRRAVKRRCASRTKRAGPERSGPALVTVARIEDAGAFRR